MVEDQIAAVLALWRQVYETEKDSASARIRFEHILQRRGWRRSCFGGFKVAMMKGSLVAKFAFDEGDNNHTQHEWNIWRRSSTYKRRFLARCYIYTEGGLLIQERHPNECRHNENCPSAKRYAGRFRICDWGKNHSHRASGLPVFFDYDNSGCGWSEWKRRRLLRSAAYGRVVT